MIDFFVGLENESTELCGKWRVALCRRVVWIIFFIVEYSSNTIINKWNRIIVAYHIPFFSRLVLLLQYIKYI